MKRFAAALALWLVVGAAGGVVWVFLAAPHRDGFLLGEALIALGALNITGWLVHSILDAEAR